MDYPHLNLIKCPGFWFSKTGIPNNVAVLYHLDAYISIPQLSVL